MATTTKTLLIQFIIDTFVQEDGEAVQKSKLDEFKKAELEEFIASKGLEDKLEAWLASK